MMDINRLTILLFLSGGFLTPVLADSPNHVGLAKVHATLSMNQIDHQDWSDLLSRYVDDQGRVDYQAWKAKESDRFKLIAYLRQLSSASLDVEARHEARLAFWINAYNALTIEGILRVYPTSSIRNHTAKLIGYNIWDDLKLYVGGRLFSLNQIEHAVLRKMDEPRIHFAIVCASKACPRLLNEAYLAATVGAQLEANARHFFAEPKNFSIDGQSIVMSSILDWFSEDFGRDESEVLRRIEPWLGTKHQRLRHDRAWKIEYREYDWSLNSKPGN